MDKENQALGDQPPPPPAGSPANKKPDRVSLKDNGRKSITPEVLQVPRASKFPDRYMSPTDLIVSFLMDKENQALGDQPPPPPAGSPANKKPDRVSLKDNGRKSITPEVLQVPRASKFADRYMSPTDLIVSPVSKRLLSRNQKAPTLSMQAKNPLMAET